MPSNKRGHKRPSGGTSLPRRLCRGRYVFELPTNGKRIMLKQRIFIILVASLFMVSVLAQENAHGKLDPKMAVEKVTGIGGLFFRAENPEALSRWYEDHTWTLCKRWGINEKPRRHDCLV